MQTPDNIVAFPFDDEGRSYSVVIDDKTTKQGKLVKNKVEFEFGLKVVEEKGKIIARFEKLWQMFNGMEILQAFDNILMETGKAFWRLDFLLDRNGGISDVVNIKEVVEQWDAKRKYVEMTYKGYLVQDFLDDMQSRVYDENLLKQLLVNDYSIAFFFRDIYRQYNKEGLYKPDSDEAGGFTLRNYLGASVIECSEQKALTTENNKRVVETQGRCVSESNIDKFLELTFNVDDYDPLNFKCEYDGKYYLNDRGFINKADILIKASYMHYVSKETKISINII